MEGLVAWAALVVIPLALAASRARDPDGQEGRLGRVLAFVQPAAALLLAVSLLTPQRRIAAALTLPWLVTTLIVAGRALRRLLARGRRPVGEFVLDTGWMYLPVGAVWMVAAAGGFGLFGFGDPIVQLTAAHFHYIPVALVTAGLVGRLGNGRSAGTEKFERWNGLFLVLTPALVALGIGRFPALEAAGGVLLSASLTGAASLGLLRSSRLASRWARFLVRTSLLALTAAMGLAALYALRRVMGPVLSIPAMVASHGYLNAVIFATLGMAGWALSPPRPRRRTPTFPVSRLRSRGRVGADFFHRTGMIRRGAGAGDDAPRGLVDDLSAYRGTDFRPDAVPSPVRHFYERTDEHSLLVIPDWAPAFSWAGQVYSRFSDRLEQMNLPVEGEREASQVASAILPLRDGPDGRDRVRGWVRAYRDTGKALYAAAYAHHSSRGRTYMNIAFPVPGGNVTSVLRPCLDSSLSGSGSPALILTTLPADDELPGDEGVYFVVGGVRVRLPVDETIRVVPAGAADFSLPPAAETAAGVTAHARHQMWIMGRPAVTLYYAIIDDREPPGRRQGRS